ncbi:hypothetical protein BJ684DRAFT_20511 [Piptocephalis cylindrospora]|uniref:Uncharacterized protein n=1 Tax=Piptocephalis cylindrospora TaxID=1907219 RepID=A0A4P9Y2D1_9FUNG|nr:hypothetical protein BJ684DRAFT_20511 [Piptocephalis cylindrospora]|eukprot:RKP12975.1 hypothetical protein BJ684DRAFT_20511 [Piptocephalis cylindrospora]
MSLETLLPPKPWYLDSRLVFLGISILYIYIYYLRHRAGMVPPSDGPPEGDICPWWWKIPWKEIMGNYAVRETEAEAMVDEAISQKDIFSSASEDAPKKARVKVHRRPRSDTPEPMEMGKPSKKPGEEEIREAAMNEYLRRQWKAEKAEAKVRRALSRKRRKNRRLASFVEEESSPPLTPPDTSSPSMKKQSSPRHEGSRKSPGPKAKPTKAKPTLMDLMAEGREQEVFHQMNPALLEAILGGKRKARPLGEDVIKSRASKSHPGRLREPAPIHRSEGRSIPGVHGSPLPIERPHPDPSYFSHIPPRGENSRVTDQYDNRNKGQTQKKRSFPRISALGKLFRPMGVQDTGNLLESPGAHSGLSDSNNSSSWLGPDRRISSPRESSGMDHLRMRTQRQRQWLEEMGSRVDVTDPGATHQRAIRPASATDTSQSASSYTSRRPWSEDGDGEGNRRKAWRESARSHSPAATSEPTRSLVYDHSSWPATTSKSGSGSPDRLRYSPWSSDKERIQERMSPPLPLPISDEASFYTAKENSEDYRIRVRGGPRPAPSLSGDSLLNAPLRRAHRERVEGAGNVGPSKGLVASRASFFGGR